MKTIQSYTQSDFNADYKNSISHSLNCTLNEMSDEDMDIKLKNDKYLGFITEFVYFQGVDDELCYTCKDKKIPMPNIILKNKDDGTYTYIYAVSKSYDTSDYYPVISEDIEKAAFYLEVKCDYSIEDFYFEYVLDCFYSILSKKLNAKKNIKID